MKLVYLFVALTIQPILFSLRRECTQMSNPLNRGSAPGRARDASQRPGTFKPGHEKVGGRKEGTPNAISAYDARTILQAAQRHGSDGIGTDGITGYFQWLLIKCPQVGCDLLSRVLLLQACGLTPDERTLTKEEINDFIEKPNKTNSAKPGKNPQRPLSDLTRLAAKHPRAFGKLLLALLPAPTGRLRRACREARRDETKAEHLDVRGTDRSTRFSRRNAGL